MKKKAEAIQTVPQQALNIHVVSNWHYLPEMPEKNREVLIAYKYDVKPIKGLWNGYKWVGSYDDMYYIKDGYANDSTLVAPEYIYAWCELPDCPKILVPF